MSATQPNKLSPRSTSCVFWGYPSDFHAYRCYDLATGKVHLSRHVIFDEHTFPFNEPLSPTTYAFLDDPPPTHTPFFQPSFPPDATTPTQPSASPTNHLAQPTSTSSQSEPHTPPLITTPPFGPSSTTPTQTPSTTLTQTTTNDHPMLTRAKAGIIKPNPRYNLAATSNISHIPTSYVNALSDPNWLRAINDEFSALQVNNTWELVPRPPDCPVICSMWLFRHKFKTNGTLERYKPRLVCNGKSQTVGIDCMETFSPVVKPATI